MWQTEKVGKTRRRLITGLFCISLFAVDVASVTPVWAQENTAVAEQTQGSDENGAGEARTPDDGNREGVAENPGEDNGESKLTNPGGEGGENQTMNPDEEKEGEGEQNPDGEKGGDNAQNPGDGKDGDDAQNPDEGKDGDAAQNPEDGKDGDAAQNSEEGKNEEDVADDADAAEQEPETPDGEDMSGTEKQESVSENDPDEPESSVSENDAEALGEVRALAVPADAIASGTYENITWVIDKDGKLTVEGTGDFAKPGQMHISDRAPWCKDSSTRGKIKTAEIRVTGMTDASYMFYWCMNLTSVSFAGSDTSAVTNMSYMFARCFELKNIDFGQNFNTSNVTDMSSMFSECEVLDDLNLSGWDTANVTNMNRMFRNCGFHRLTLGGNFTTRSVTDMGLMFACNPEFGNQDRTGLKWLDLSWLDLSSVDGMYGIFANCDVKQLDFGRLNTDGVTSLRGLFIACDVTGMDFSELRTDTVTNMSQMFGCPKGEIDLHTLNTEHVTDMSAMFADIWMIDQYFTFGGSSVTKIDLSGLNTENVTDIGDMFANQDMTSVNLSGLDFGKIRYMDDLFWGCSSLSSVNLSGIDTSAVVNMSGMFYGCSSLTNIDLSGMDIDNLKDWSSLFSGCTNLKEVKLGDIGKNIVNLNVNVEGTIEKNYINSTSWMFNRCSSLESLDLSNFNYNNIGASKSDWMFSECDKLTTIYTPYNVAKEIPLPEGDWYMADGTKLEDNCLPKNLSYSVLIRKGSKPSVSEVRMEVSKQKTLYGCGEAINTDDLTVKYYGADGSVRKLAEKTDETDGYTTNVASLSTAQPGTLELVVTYTKDGKTLTGEITLTVAHILTADNTIVTFPAEDYTYDGQPKQPVPTAVSYTQNAAGGAGTPVTLTEGTDYTLSYRNNRNAYEPFAADGSGEGTVENGAATAAAPTVIIRGAGKYSGSVTKTFAIAKAASPAAETMDVTGSRCTQANAKRIADLTGSFTACGKKTGYEILSVEDPKGIFSQTPVTADIRDGVLTYGTKAAQEGDTASIKVKVSFANYKDAELTVRITMAARKAAVISGITMEESVVYSGAPVSCGGEAVVKTEDGQDITEQVSLVYQYSGVMADGTVYPAHGGTAEPPVNAGNYTLTVLVSDDDPDYVGSVSYPFAIRKADAVVRAKDLIVLMQAAQGGSALIPVEQYQKEFGYTVTGLLNGDTLRTEPAYTVTEDEAGAKNITAIDTSKAGTYYIHPSGADAGMNYDMAYKPGILTVSEERVAYTVTFDGMGHCDTFTKRGIKAGDLLELTEEERMPAAKEKGYVFAGWFKDKTFDKGKEWSFDTDTVQTDLTLYACWLTAAGEDGNGLKLCVQEIPDMTYTGNAWKPAVTVYDSDGTTLLKAGKDYTVKYVRNTDAVAVDENGRPKEAGGTAKVTNPGKTNEQCTDVAGHFTKDCPYVVIMGKGNYTETVYRNFLILPTQISADADGKTESGNMADGGSDTPLAAGFTMRYTNQFEAKAGRTAKIVSSVKYKKALKEGKDYSVSVADESGENVALTQGKLPLNAGSYTMTITGKGNYTGVVTRKLYVAEKQKLMKNVSITLGKNQKTRAYTGENVLLTPGYYDAKTKKNHKVTSDGVVNSTPEANANDMFLVKAGKESLIWGKDYTISYEGTNRAVGTATMTLMGKNGYVGTKSVTFKITGTPFSVRTIDVKAYDAAHPNEKDWKASLPYTGRALTQNQVTLTTKATQKEPEAKELVYGEHYTITYKNNVKKGTATVTFTAKPESGYTGSIRKTFKITPQELSGERLFITPQGGDKPTAVYGKNGAKLSFAITNEAGAQLCEGTDYTVKYKNNNAVTTAQTPENKTPIMTVTGKGNYAGKVEVSFTVVQASLADAIDSGTVSVSCAQVQKKDGMKFPDFKFKLVEGKKALAVGETKDYVIDGSGCTPEILKAYADAVDAGTVPLPQEPAVKVTGKGYYTGEKTIALGEYVYADKLTAACAYVVVSEGAGQSIYTGGQVRPEVAVYYGEKTAVSAAKKDKVKEETALTAETGKYKLKKLAAGDYKLSYGANTAAGKNKGSVTVTGTGRYGGSVTVKFEIGKKAIY